MVHVLMHRMAAEAKHDCDFAIGLSLRNPEEDFAFAGGKAVVGEAGARSHLIDSLGSSFHRGLESLAHFTRKYLQGLEFLVAKILLRPPGYERNVLRLRAQAICRDVVVDAQRDEEILVE